MRTGSMRTPRPIGVKRSNRWQKRSSSVAMKPNPPEWRPSDELIQMEAQLFPDGFTLRDEANAIVAMAFRNGPDRRPACRQVVRTFVEPRAEQDHRRRDENAHDQRARARGKASAVEGKRSRGILQADDGLQSHVLPQMETVNREGLVPSVGNSGCRGD